MIHCPMCGLGADAKTTEHRRERDGTAIIVEVFHHQAKRKTCRQWEAIDDGDDDGLTAYDHGGEA